MTTTRNLTPGIRRASFFVGLPTIAVALAALWWLRQPSPEMLDTQPSSHSQATNRPSTPKQPQVAPAPSMPDRQDDAMWTAVDEATVANPPHYAAEWSVEGRALVRISDMASIPWQVGDRLTLPLPQLGETYRPVIEEIDEAVGSRALLGKITGDDGHRRRYVVTIGPTAVFAFIDTPRGTYELMADRDHGWLLPSSSMMAAWDFSKSDIILRERDAGAAR